MALIRFDQMRQEEREVHYTDYESVRSECARFRQRLILHLAGHELADAVEPAA
jgi:hypothetical protein